MRINPADGPSASPEPIPNADTWLDFTDLVFIDPPGTGYSHIVTTDGEARRHLWSVGGDIDALAEAIRRWLDRGGRTISLDPHMRVLVAHGMFDLITPYFGAVRTLRLLPKLDGAAPIEPRVYPGGHMFYFDDSSRAALRTDAKAVFDPVNATGVSR